MKFLSPPALLTPEYMATLEAMRQDAIRVRRENNCCAECGTPLTLRATAGTCPDAACLSHGAREAETDHRR